MSVMALNAPSQQSKGMQEFQFCKTKRQIVMLIISKEAHYIDEIH